MTNSMDLFDEPHATPMPHTGMPTTSFTATATGQPPEWGHIALDAVFANRKANRKEHVAAATEANLVRAMWTFALARHDALLAPRSAEVGVTMLSGHRNLRDQLDNALRVIESHAVEVRDIPPARAFTNQLDLRSLAGQSPFPLPQEMPAAPTAEPESS